MSIYLLFFQYLLWINLFHKYLKLQLQLATYE
nr:MAG TPA: hypothetical protein [Bacteriophage sp.]